jgi:hypothetical protein
MPEDILMGAGNSPVRLFRQIVVAEKGTTLKLIKGRTWIIAISGKSLNVVIGLLWFILPLLGVV